MISRYRGNGLTWIDLESPSGEEIAHIVEEFDLPGVVGEEMATTVLPSKVDLYENFIYVVLHFPIVDKHGVHTGEQEVDFVISKDFLITVRYELIDPMHEFSKLFETDRFLERDQMSKHGGFIFMQIMKQFYMRSLGQLELVGKTLKEIERGIFAKEDTTLLKRISHTSRTLLDFKQALRFHHEILKSYESKSRRLFGEAYGYYAELITAEFNKVNSLLESNRDVLAELQRTNDSLLSAKSNEIMKTFTIMTFVMMPLTIITGIFGMNTIPSLIFIRSLGGFYLIIAAMLITGLTMFIFFKIKRWI